MNDKNPSEDTKNTKRTISEKEHDTLAFWKENQIFEKSVEQNARGESFVFYDGPPFATGLPHYGHLLQGAIKDLIPRYQTMRGKHVRRVWGWDCHGLPIEHLIEKELGLNSKKDIEEYGIQNFNEKARDSVFRYEEEWQKVVPRFGRWIDMENPYKTMDPEYTESVWWAFQKLHEKSLVYQGHKAMHICPRCETTLAASEVAQGYAEVKDISVTAKFELEDEPGTYLLAWTTTPWTLPGNVALAVGAELLYVKVQVDGEQVILAKALLENVLGEKEYEVLDEFSGEALVGKKYEPVFSYYKDSENLENHENGWKVYAADFVEDEGGTGIVHIAPAFGEDDLVLGRTEKLPFVQHVKMNGEMKPEVTDFAGMVVKKKDDTMSTDIEIIKKLAHDEKLFSKEKMTHSYPLCWRCDTPLLNYAASSWFVEVTKIRDDLVAENKQIGWVPEKVGENRFGKWLEGARDWAVSRSRFWGAPIPVWKCEDCEKMEFVGSLKDIQEKQTKNKNHFTVMRHGEAESNVSGTINSDITRENHVTDAGKEQILEKKDDLSEKNIDLIISSDLMRTKETAEKVASELGLSDEQVIYDARIRELSFGDMEGWSVEDYHAAFENDETRFTKSLKGAETLSDLKTRVMDFLFDVNEKYEEKNILIISHQSPLGMMLAGADMETKETLAAGRWRESHALGNVEVRELDFTPFPHNEKFELDFHRPYIDEVTFSCDCGGEMARVPEVFDCWFESGSMPYGQFHYPFENTDTFERNFPANFIAEGLDQTRGWFYNMLVLSMGLFGQSAYKNVITTGLVLAEDGQKMSKKLKNYPDPLETADKYGADAVRFYMLNSPIVRGEELFFSEKGVDEVTKKIVFRLGNVASFYELYAEEGASDVRAEDSQNALDVWIRARLSELISEVETNLEAYEIDRAARPIGEFIDDFSTWYLRRSRDRFKSDDEEDRAFALATLRETLLELSKVLAPFMPFFAEDLYMRASGKKDQKEESVHLESWPSVKASDENILSDMEITREVVSLGLEARTEAGIKVRQPLSKLTVKNDTLSGKEDFIALVKDEMNVKEVAFDRNLETEVELDTEITDELREEGELREFVRSVQSLRKNGDLEPGEVATLRVETDEEGKAFLEKFQKDLEKSTTVTLAFGSVDEGSELTLGEKDFKMKL